MTGNMFDGFGRALGCLALVLVLITVILTLLIRSCSVKYGIRVYNKQAEATATGD